MRKHMVAVLFGCVLAGAPVAAVGWDESWLEQAPHPVEPSYDLAPGTGPLGTGWSSLDGWMRGDPLLRQWVLRRFDLNGDTWLSDEEAAMARRAFYTVADSNRSGIINRDEFVAGWVAVRQDLRRFYGFDVG